MTTSRADTHVDQQRGLAAHQADKLNSLLGIDAHEPANPLREGAEMFSLEKVAELLGHLWVVFVEDGDLLELLRTVVVVAAWVALVVDLAFIIKKLEGFGGSGIAIVSNRSLGLQLSNATTEQHTRAGAITVARRLRPRTRMSVTLVFTHARLQQAAPNGLLPTKVT